MNSHNMFFVNRHSYNTIKLCVRCHISRQSLSPVQISTSIALLNDSILFFISEHCISLTCKHLSGNCEFLPVRRLVAIHALTLSSPQYTYKEMFQVLGTVDVFNISTSSDHMCTLQYFIHVKLEANQIQQQTVFFSFL